MAATIFISYSHCDSEYKNNLEKHLVVLRDNGKIDDWSDGQILPGDNWDAEINKELKTAEVILLLVSSDFLSSGYIKRSELSNALERNKKGECRVIPIILRHCAWEASVIGQFQAIPSVNGKIVPISSWQDKDEAYYTVAAQIERVVNRSNTHVTHNEHSDTPKNTTQQPFQSPTAPTVINIAGSWRDRYSPANGVWITQEGNSFHYEGWGFLVSGMPFRTNGNGTVIGNNITMRYSASYQNGWVSQGGTWGNVSPDGLVMTLNFTDTLLGPFVFTAVRQ